MSVVCPSEVLLAQSPCVTCWVHLQVPWPLAPYALFQSKALLCPLSTRSAGPCAPLHPTAACYCTTQPSIGLSAFSLSLSLSATWGNDSITYDPIHLLMRSAHSKAHLRPMKGSSYRSYSLLGTSTQKLILQGARVFVRICVLGQMHASVNIPCSFSPCSFSSETLANFWFVYECMFRESRGGKPCASKNIWHCWDADTCRWTGESALRIIRT